MCSRSAMKTGRPPIRRRNTDREVSRIGRPKETTGMATATAVGAFWELANAKALSINPMNKLPQSPRKMVAGLKLKRRNPRIAPANTIVSSDRDDDPLKIATKKTIKVEKSAEPAARPSSPSIKLNAFVIPITHRIVMGSPKYQDKCRMPNKTGRELIPKPPAYSIAAARPCTANLV